jgi:hypothetical protein
MRQAAEWYVGIVMMIIGKRGDGGDENDSPHCFGGRSGNSRRGDCGPRARPVARRRRSLPNVSVRFIRVRRKLSGEREVWEWPQMISGWPQRPRH